MEKYITFSAPNKKNVIMVKQLHTNYGLLIVLDLCRLHYQIFLITCLELLLVKNAQNVRKEKKLTQNAFLLG